MFLLREAETIIKSLSLWLKMSNLRHVKLCPLCLFHIPKLGLVLKKNVSNFRQAIQFLREKETLLSSKETAKGVPHSFITHRRSLKHETDLNDLREFARYCELNTHFAQAGVRLPLGPKQVPPKRLMVEMC